MKCAECSRLWLAYARVATQHVALLQQEEKAMGTAEWPAVTDALTAVAWEHDWVRRAIVQHEAAVHHRQVPLESRSTAPTGTPAPQAA